MNELLALEGSRNLALRMDGYLINVKNRPCYTFILCLAHALHSSQKCWIVEICAFIKIFVMSNMHVLDLMNPLISKKKINYFIQDANKYYQNFGELWAMTIYFTMTNIFLKMVIKMHKVKMKMKVKELITH